MAIGTGPLSFPLCLLLEDASALMAGLAGGIKTVNCHYSLIVPLGFVLKQPYKSTPGYILDMPGQFSVFEQTFYVQVLYYYNIIRIGYLHRYLVQQVHSGVRYLFIDTGYFEALFITIPGALHLVTKMSLGCFQLL